MSENSEILREFLLESYENLDQMDGDLVGLEQAPTSPDLLGRVFRTIHTIKGTCGFLALGKLEQLTHVGENLLVRLRDGELQLNAERTSALLALGDEVRQILACIEATETEGDLDTLPLIETLTRLVIDTPAPMAKDEPVAPAAASESPTAAVLDATPKAPKAKRPKRAPRQRKAAPVELRALPPATGAEKLVSILEGVTPEPPEPRKEEASPERHGESKRSSVSETTIRADVGLLDKLMDLVGELVLARNQILQFTATMKDGTLLRTAQRLNLITTELQEGVMKTRMLPIDTVWSKFPRVARDLGLACGKQVRVEMEGRETEMDRTILEAIKDPLTHLVRNAIDHGLESPEERVSAGKAAEGRLLLRAYHEGGQVNIEISDDGRGIDVDRVRTKALERALISREQSLQMSTRSVLNLIFLPGFSTAEKVTNVSGRGVGMDVVRTNIEKIGGIVDVQTERGRGTTFKIKIPLTLAIIPALIVTAGSQRYAIPQVSLLELVRLEGEAARKGIEMIHGAPVYRLRGKLLPLVYLTHELKLDEIEALPGQDKVVNIVVLQSDGRQFGLVIDTVNDTEEIVVKPLAKQLKGINCFAGATIMGDGQVTLILDVLGIAQHSGMISESRERSLSEPAEEAEAGQEESQTLLLFEGPGEGRMAIPLSMVARLEELPCSAVEHTGSLQVVQYRGQILPLISLGSVLQERSERSQGPVAATLEAVSDTMHVIVCTEQGRSVGIVVERLLDIVQETLSVKGASSRRGVLGTVVIQGRVTELLDIQTIVQRALPDLLWQVDAA